MQVLQCQRSFELGLPCIVQKLFQTRSLKSGRLSKLLNSANPNLKTKLQQIFSPFRHRKTQAKENVEIKCLLRAINIDRLVLNG